MQEPLAQQGALTMFNLNRTPLLIFIGFIKSSSLA